MYTCQFVDEVGMLWEGTDLVCELHPPLNPGFTKEL